MPTDTGDVFLAAANSLEFTKSERAGVIVIAVAGSISALSTFLLLLHIVIVAVVPLLSKKKAEHNEERVFLRMQLGVFVVCLIVSDLIQSIAILIQTRWAHKNGIQHGTACIVQGALIQLGDNGTAVWNAIVAIHTFMTVVLGKRIHYWTVTAMFIGGWTLVVLLNVIGPAWIATSERGPFWGIAALWCFITSDYSIERIFLHYFPMLLSAAIITVMYIAIFLTLRGNLVYDGKGWSFYWRLSDRIAPGNSGSRNNLHMKALAKKMLWYPLAYIILVLPISILRISNDDTAMIPLVFSMTLLTCMGTTNVVIYVSTRKIGPVPWFSRSHSTGNETTRNPQSRSMQIYVDRVTHVDTKIDDIDLASISSRNQREDRKGLVTFERVGTYDNEAVVAFSDPEWKRDGDAVELEHTQNVALQLPRNAWVKGDDKSSTASL